MASTQASYSRRLWWAVRPLWLWRLLRLLLRSGWLAALVWAGGWAASRAAGWPLSWLDWAAIASVTGLLFFILMAGWPVRRQSLSSRLDRAMGYHEQLLTADQVARRQPANYLEAQLLADANRLLADARHKLLRRPCLPWGDLEMGLLAAALVYGCFLYAQISPPPVAPIPEAASFVPLPELGAEATVNLPGLPLAAAAGLAPFAETDANNLAGLDPVTAQQVLSALGQALDQEALTRPAATALQQGDADAAAEAIRSLADTAAQMSAEARASIAESLQAVASQTEATAPEAADQMAQAASDLDNQSGSAAQRAARAGSALESLARLIEALEAARSGSANDLTGPGEGAGLSSNAGREQQASTGTDRLDAAGETIDLPEGAVPDTESGALQAPNSTETGTTQRSSTPYSQTGVSGSGGEPATDPLHHPWRLRDVVQRYFSPP